MENDELLKEMNLLEDEFYNYCRKSHEKLLQLIECMRKIDSSGEKLLGRTAEEHGDGYDVMDDQDDQSEDEQTEMNNTNVSQTTTLGDKTVFQNDQGWKQYHEVLYTAHGDPKYLAAKNAGKPADEQTMVLSPAMLPQGSLLDDSLGEAPTTKMDISIEVLFSQALFGSVWKQYPYWQQVATEDDSLCATSGRLYFCIYPQNPVLVRFMAERIDNKRIRSGIEKLNSMQHTWSFKFENGLFYCDCYLTTDIPLADASMLCCDAARKYFQAEL